MKGAELGANCLVSCGAMSQAVVPATGLPSASVQSKAAPPQAWTSIPKCRLYQACSDGASLALKKMPPMPVTRFMGSPMRPSSGLRPALAAQNASRGQREQEPDRQRLEERERDVDQGILVHLLELRHLLARLGDLRLRGA